MQFGVPKRHRVESTVVKIGDHKGSSRVCLYLINGTKTRQQYIERAFIHVSKLRAYDARPMFDWKEL